ncbi:MAG TPA: cob(I)yrinic acid a,c-diamide adenosyltransferase [Thermoanaerobaculia bacterium]|nr:cob(I)yrinic acid a,c-diamide adenosyltransferase [Thermoanaerobaculia bacterium]
MRITKVYTRLGDRGTTSLIGGDEVAKDSARIESYGTVDELGAVLGLLRAELTWTPGRAGPPHPEERRELVTVLHRVQNDLFDLGNMLSAPERLADQVPKPVTPERVAWLEETMDAWNGELSPLRSFVLAGGGRFSALAHHARTVCRRCERRVVALGREEAVAPEVLRYLNRLSDLLFVLARHLARVFGEEEPLWETPLRE